MKIGFKVIIVLIIFIFIFQRCGTLLSIMTENVKLPSSDSMPIDHDSWNALLQKHVKGGLVDYKGFIKDSISFNDYLASLSKGLPNDQNWSKDEQFVYWINAYNAFTVKLIIDNYPTNSIKDIKGGVAFVNSIWDKKFIEIEGKMFDLNNIEHGILREKFKDPRIHFAINCASISCPDMLNTAYTANNIDQQLDQVTKAFLYNKSKNEISSEEAKLSKIFKWFKSDFTSDGVNLITYINQYLDSPIPADTKISHLDYDWNLNEIRE